MRRTNFLKGHGTRNDFVIIDDQHGMQDLTPEMVATMCDRRSGVGADGVLRVVKAAHIPEWSGDPDLWFMDYRNADGSIAEMCGNGLRVFARHLLDEDWVAPGEFSIATRAGVRRARVNTGGLISVSMGTVVVEDDSVAVLHCGQRWSATKVDVGNPHAVVFVSAETLSALDLSNAPQWEPCEVFPQGTNIEFVAEEAPGEISMRVHERGSGETESCGTGVVASAAAHRARTGYEGDVQVRVRGGQLGVEFAVDEVWLTGPAVMVARGELWW